MTKADNKTPKRTRPLDRDGDGADGGSLPGNRTAPLLDAADDVPPWTRVDAEILEDLQLMDEGWSGTVETLTLDQVKSWTDADAQAAQAYAEAIIGLSPERRPAAPDFLQPFLVSKPAKTPPDAAADPAAAPEATVGDPPPPAEAGDPAGGGGDHDAEDEATFTAEEIAAGRTPVVQEEGEGSTDAAQLAAGIDPADPLVTVETATAPLAVRLSNLRRLVDNRWLYRTADGYSSTYAAPFVGQDEIDAWIAAGLAVYEPTAGREGGVKALNAARRAVTRPSTPATEGEAA